MIVDDKFDLIELFTEVLKANSYQVTGFSYPLVAFEHLKQNQDEFDLILSDYKKEYLSDSI